MIARQQRLSRAGLLLRALVLLTLFASCGQRDATSFTEEVAQKLSSRLPAGSVQITAPRTIELRHADGTKSSLSLDNLWTECDLRPETCEASMERFVRATTQTDASLEEAQNRKAIRATIRDQGWVDALVEKGASPVTKPFVGDLVKVYVFDLPDGMMAVMRSDLDKLEMTEEELDAAGMANLDEAANSFPHEPVESGSPIQVLSVGDDYESARLLLHDRWKALAQTVKGDLLVGAPSRNYLFFVGSGEGEDVVARFQALVEKSAGEESNPLSSTILRWTPEKWIVFRSATKEVGGKRSDVTRAHS